MTIPFYRDGFALPVTPALLALLSQEAERTDLDLGRCTQLTFNFRNPGYSAEQGKQALFRVAPELANERLWRL